MWAIKRFPILWIAPVLIPVALFVVIPVPYAIWTSLHQVQLLFPDTDFVGLDNFRSAIRERSAGLPRVCASRAMILRISSPASNDVANRRQSAANCR